MSSPFSSIHTGLRFSLTPHIVRSSLRVLAAIGLSVFVAGHAAAQKLVVAHQMLALHRYTSLTPSIEAIGEDIETWKDLGLDGVMLFDVLPFKEAARQYYRAGERYEFKFAITAGWMDSNTSYHREFLTELAGPEFRDAQLYYRGRYLLSDYAGNPNLIKLTHELEPVVGPIHLQPHVVTRDFNGDPFSQPWEAGWFTGSRAETYDILFDHPDWARADGFASFDIMPTNEAQADLIRALASASKARGKTARAALVAHYKCYAHKGNWMVYENLGYGRLRDAWLAAIESDIDAVEFITMNDMSETSYINSWGPNDPVILVNHWNTGDNAAILDHSGFRYFSKRYVQWFKTGVEPAINEDELYYAYRLHPRDAVGYYYLTAEQKAAVQQWVPSGQPAEWIYRREPVPVGPNRDMGIDWRRLSDGIHTVVRLKEPADVYINGAHMGTYPAGEHLITKWGEISEGSSSWGYDIHTFGPSDFGFPRFEIRRNGQTVVNHVGELEITPFSLPGCWNMFARKAPATAQPQPAPAPAPMPLIISPAGGSTIEVGAPIAISADVSDQAGLVNQVEFFAGTTKIGEDSSAPYSLVWSNAPAGTHSLRARAVTESGGSATSNPVLVTVEAPVRSVGYQPQGGAPLTLLHKEIGSVSMPGNVTVSGDSISITAAGTDIWDYADEFHFAWLELMGDLTVTARVNSLGATNEWSKAGVMIRESLAAGARHAFMIATPAKGTNFQRRVSANGPGATSPGPAMAPPVWVRIERSGSIIRGYASGDGANWELVDSETIALGSKVYAGLAVTSHNPDAATTAVFSNVSFTGGGLTPPASPPVPTPTIMTPANGSSFDQGSPISIGATLTGDTSTLARVEFYAGDSKIGEDASAPFGMTWNAAPVGDHSITAKSVTTAGMTATSSAITVNVKALQPAPVPTISAPAAGAVFDAGAPITIQASLSGSVARVEFYAGATKLGEDTSAPYSLAWTNATVGNHSLKARAITAQGKTADSAAVSITVRAPAPVPTITSPKAGSAFNPGAAVNITASLPTTSGVARVEFYAGSNKIGQDTKAPYAASWSNPPAGLHSLTARAVTTAGATATSAAVAFTVRAPAPVPVITSPVEGAQIESGTAISVNVALNGDTSKLARVEFYSGATKLGEDLSAPYGLIWTGAAAGTHSLIARAITTETMTATSSAVSVTVKPIAPEPPKPVAGGTVNVRDYGAKGDGVTDDTLAIRKAIAAIGPLAGTVYLPAGTYQVSPQNSGGDALTIDFSKLTIRGDGPDTILSFHTFGGGNPATAWETISGAVHRGSVIVINGTNSITAPRTAITIADLRITGNAAPTGSIATPANVFSGDGWDASHHAIKLAPGTYVSGVRLENLELDNFRGEIVYAAGATNGMLEILDSRIHSSNAIGVAASADLRLIGNEIYDHAYAAVVGTHLNRTSGYPQHGYYFYNTIEPRRSLTTNGLHGLVLRTEGDASHSNQFRSHGLYVSVQENVIKHSLHYGLIGDQGLFDPNIEANEFVDNGASGDPLHGHIALRAGAASGGLKLIEGAVIRGNTFFATGQTPSGYAVFLDAGANTMRDVEIQQNALTNPTSGTNVIRRFLLLSSANGSTVSRLVFAENSANTIPVAVEDLSKATHRTPRPLYRQNNVSASSLSPLDDDFAVSFTSGEIYPVWARTRVTPSADRVPISLASNINLYPDRTELTISVAPGGRGVVLPRDKAWNRFNSEIYLASGQSIVLAKKAGRFEMKTVLTSPSGPEAPGDTPAPTAPLSIALNAPDGGEVVPAGQPVTFEASVSGGKAAIAYVEFFEGTSALGRVTAAPHKLTWNPPGSGGYAAYARVVDVNGSSVTSAVVTFSVDRPAASNPQDGLQHVDIGGATPAGSSRYDSLTRVYTIESAGTDIWDDRDEFRFDHQMLEGDGELVVQVRSLVAVHEWSKAGLMIRASLESGAAHASMFATPGNGVSFQHRMHRGGSSEHTTINNVDLPVWLKLRREGSTFIGFFSSGGELWTEVGRTTIAMPQTVYAGLATTSHLAGVRTTAVYADFALIPGGGDFVSVDIGAVGLAGTGAYNETTDTHSISAAGRDIHGRADAFHFRHKTMTGDRMIMARVEGLDAANGWAKAGLMIRNGLAADAANVVVGITPSHGIIFQYRVAAGKETVVRTVASAQAPVYLALERAGDVVNAYFSPDGVSWEIAGSVSLPLPGEVSAGLAVTSRDPDARANVEFNGVGVVP